MYGLNKNRFYPLFGVKMQEKDCFTERKQAKRYFKVLFIDEQHIENDLQKSQHGEKIGNVKNSDGVAIKKQIR